MILLTRLALSKMELRLVEASVLDEYRLVLERRVRADDAMVVRFVEMRSSALFDRSSYRARSISRCIDTVRTRIRSITVRTCVLETVSLGVCAIRTAHGE